MEDEENDEIDEEVEVDSEVDPPQLFPLVNEQMAQHLQLGELMSQYVMQYDCKEPCRTSAQAGHSWVQEVLQGHPTWFRELFRMEQRIFNLLCSKLIEHGLQMSRLMGVQEMVALFLIIVGHGYYNRMVQEMFQHSGETISRHFHKVLNATIGLSSEIIKPEDPIFCQYHPNIRNDRQYWPFFKDAIGAIDGTHVQCKVKVAQKDKYIGRKGYPTQNIMVVCDWNMCFTFVLVGWEGTAHDARIFHVALLDPSMNFPHPPPGKYYLVDAGYPTPMGYLSPYRRHRYHLGDFRRQPGFRNSNEAFNYYHSSLSCTIERTFGVWKNRFAIL